MAEIKQAKFIDQTGQEKDAVFIGAEKAIYDDSGKRLDQKLEERKKASGLLVTDTQGILGGAGTEVSLQTIIDKVAEKIMKELVSNASLVQTLSNYMTKAMMSNVQMNDHGKVPTSALAYAMQQSITKNAQDITQLNSDLPYVIRNADGNRKPITTSEWKFSGTKITIPSGYIAIITASCGWNKGQPLGVAISNSDSKLSAISVTRVSGEDIDSHAITTTCFAGLGNYYLWSKHNHLAEDELASEYISAALFKIK